MELQKSMNANANSVMRVVKETPNLRELTTETLRNAIVTMHFKPGERLVERMLCEETGVSRTCVREALMQLETEGLIERVQNKGLYVASISPDEARQIYEVRAALESAAGRMFVERASDKEVKALESAFAKVKKSAPASSVMPYVAALHEFYEVLLTGSRNDVAKGVLHNLRARMNYLRILTSQKSQPKYKDQGVQLMHKIVKSAVARDPDKTAQHCREFVERSAGFAIQVLQEQEQQLTD
jgi:DNA-binding GntR family transcriptional regulator